MTHFDFSSPSPQFYKKKRKVSLQCTFTFLKNSGILLVSSSVEAFYWTEEILSPKFFLIAKQIHQFCDWQFKIN